MRTLGLRVMALGERIRTWNLNDNLRLKGNFLD